MKTPLIQGTGAYADMDEYQERFVEESLTAQEVAVTYAHALMQWTKDNHLDMVDVMKAARTRFSAEQPPLR